MDGEPPPAAAPFRLAVGAYVGAVVAGSAAVVAATAEATAVALVIVTLVSLGMGAVAGVAVASRVRALPTRLGRSRRRRAVLAFPVLPFAAMAVASHVSRIETPRATVALGATVGIALAGWFLAGFARSAYVDAVVEDEPVLATSWEPDRSPALYGLLLATWLFLAVSNAVVGDWAMVILWVGLGVAWAGQLVLDGRWRIGTRGRPTELRIHERGLVKRRPYTQSLVPWEDVRHVRVREGALVVERGPFDVRFDRDQLADPEAVLAAIERTSSTRVVP